MDKFWKWMKEKLKYELIEYSKEFNGYLVEKINDYEKIFMTKQMLIGYMIEYILPKYQIHTIELAGNKDIEFLYTYLKGVINDYEEVKND